MPIVVHWYISLHKSREAYIQSTISPFVSRAQLHTQAAHSEHNFFLKKTHLIMA